MDSPPDTNAADPSAAADSSSGFPPLPPPSAPPQPPTAEPPPTATPPAPRPSNVPPPPPRATLPPVRPAQIESSPVESPPAESPDDSIWDGSDLPAANPIVPPAPVASAAKRPAASRWRTEAMPAAESDESGELEPVKRSIPAWLVSMVVHLIVLLVLALLTTPVGQGISSIVLEFGEATEADNFDLQRLDLESSESLVDSTNDADSEAVVDMDIQSLMETVQIQAEPLKMVPVENAIGSASDLVQPMFSGRSGAMKSALLAMYGGNDVTMDAVERGLRWLARNQEKSGSWSMAGPYSDGAPFSENRAAATAMALLAFQGDGNTHKFGPFADNVDRGLKHLLKNQRRDGMLATDARSDEQRAYAHAQATIAVCELYAMTGDSNLREPAQAAVDYCVNAQSSAGGWRYRPRFDSDLSVTGWYVMALTSAQSAGLEVPSSTLQMANTYLDLVQHYDGSGYSYVPNQRPSYAMTAEGLLCRQYLGWPRDTEALAVGVNDLVQGGMLDTNNPNVYYWYYATQVLHHYGGEPWAKWNAVMKTELPRTQLKRGDESGSWSPQGDEWGGRAGRLYMTCLSIYCLEVYYRHLPLYKNIAE